VARILITGGAGYVGSHCTKLLAAAGHECLVFDSLRSSGQGASVREVIEAARATTGRPIKAHVAPRRPGDPPMLVADATSARKLLGWSAERSDLATILADAWRWHGIRFQTSK
jgi:UDP-glucose 4-epimerase